MRWLPSSVCRPLSVSCHISKTKQDRLMVTMGTLFGNWHHWFCYHIQKIPQTLRWEIFGFQIQNMWKWLPQHGFLFDLASDHSCCKPSTTVVSPTVWLTVENGVRRSIVVRSVDGAKSEQEAGHLLFAVRTSCFLFVLNRIPAICYIFQDIGLEKYWDDRNDLEDH